MILKRKRKKDFFCCYGISSKASVDNQHVLFLDYDTKNLHNIVEHLHYLQEEYGLSDIYVIGSTNGFNAVCLDVLPLSVCYAIGTDILSPCDRDFFKYAFNRGYFTLRFDCDKELRFILESDNRKHERSLAHKKFLEWFFSIEIKDDSSFNGYTKIDFIQFPSSKNGYHLVEKNLPSNLKVMRE